MVQQKGNAIMGTPMRLADELISERTEDSLINKGHVRHRVQTHRTVQYVFELVVVFAAYFLTGMVGLAIPFTSGNVSPVWPPSGIALAAILMLGYRIWPAVAVGAFLVNFFTPIPTVAALGIAVGNTLGPLTGAWLLRRLPSFHPMRSIRSLTRLKDVLALIVFAALGATAISATLGATALSLTPVNPWSSFGRAWLVWYLGDAMGVLIVTPPLLTFTRLVSIREPRQVLNLAALVAGAVISCLFIFDKRLGFSTQEDLFAFAVFPFVIWGAIRFEAAGAAAVTFLISVVVTLETVYGFGPFGKGSPLQNAMLLQSFLGVISISGMTLAAVNSERAQMIREQARREHVEAERLAAREMEIARQVQIKLLPQSTPRLTTLEYAATSVQARAVGGDYYDFLDLGSGRVALAMADVSGKGISAALLMANLQANLRSQSGILLQDLPRSLQFVNRMFYESTEPNNYATLFVGIYYDASRRLSYVNCGHNPQLLLRGETIERLAANVTVLGLFKEWQCTVAETTLVPGDLLVLYTDGVVEATNAKEEEFGEAGLVQILRENRHLDAASLLETVIATVQQFGVGENRDDLTLLVARVH
jgi:serine phosphatase RsbU (regulator of sigma subunit)/integral membrane sensor domain MASE1